MRKTIVFAACAALGVSALPSAHPARAQAPDMPPPPTYYPAPVQAAPPVSFSTAQIGFGHVPWGTQPFLLVSMFLSPAVFDPACPPRLLCSDPDVRVTLASQTVPPLRPNLPRSQPAPVVQVWRLTLAAHPHLGPLRGTLSLVTDADPASPEAAALRAAGLPLLSGEIAGEFACSAPNLLFGTVTAGQAAARTLTLSAQTGAELRGLKASTVLPCLALTVGSPVSDGAAGAHAVLTATLGKSAPVGDLQTEIAVTDAHGQTLVVPVYANVSPVPAK